MKKQNLNNLLFVILLILVSSSSVYSQKLRDRDFDILSEKTIKKIKEKGLVAYNFPLEIDSAIINIQDKELQLYFSKELSYLPIRESWLQELESTIRGAQKRRIRKKYKIDIFSNTELLSTYIPNIYRTKNTIDSTRFEKRNSTKISNVTNLDNEYVLTYGLQNKHIAVWGGHGLYFSQEDSIWKWQRPNLFTTVEDMFTYSYVVPYIIPMLQNAGANVYYPKERDTQIQELIVDFDTNKSEIILSDGVSNSEGGFKLKTSYTDSENPFKLGTHHQMRTATLSGKKDSIIYKINNLKKGKFAVYISYSNSGINVDDVEYIVHHDGGKTSFSVNQKMGHNTWIYLGEFQFGNKSTSKIIVRNSSKHKGIITSDAIKIGGGYNRIEREGTLCDKPAYLNAGRYYLQYAGAPDSTVYSTTKGEDDYKDDYKSRGEWVNYLLGQPYSINRDSSLQGLNIPIDMSLAFHTDAGTTKTDSVIGTLTIHSTYDINMKREFPDGRSRFANRDLADIVHTEIVGLIHDQYNSKWTRRSMWDKQYSEATYPNVPSLLIELMSHQNFGDMKYGLDPNFKFDVSRAIYKGILKFLAHSNNQSYVVSPLPVNSFAVNYEDKKLILSWSKTVDETEETSNPDSYIVYTKIGDNGFDNGTLVKGEEYIFDSFKLGQQYSFKVKAVNKGGVSFDSETLSANIFSYADNPVLIINAFEKTSAPEYFDTDSLGGFSDWKKGAIANGIDVSYTGNQYNFDKTNPWVTNALTGHGASYSDYEGMQVMGNTFNYPYVHGLQFSKHKISFVSVSIKAFENGYKQYLGYNKVDLIYGKQSSYNLKVNQKKYNYCIFRKSTRDAFEAWLSSDKSILISGAFVASDVYIDNVTDTVKTAWVNNYFDYDLVTDKASVNGGFYSDDKKHSFKINKKPIGNKYELRSVDAIQTSENGKVLYRYSENKYPAAIFSKAKKYKVLVLGFPLESLKDNKEVFFYELLKTLEWQ